MIFLFLIYFFLPPQQYGIARINGYEHKQRKSRFYSRLKKINIIQIEEPIEIKYIPNCLATCTIMKNDDNNIASTEKKNKDNRTHKEQK